MNKDNFIKLLKTLLVPLHGEGIKFVLIFAFATLIAAMISSTLGLIGLVLTLWCVFFFRDPERFIPQGKDLIISPADGIINDIENSICAPQELGFPKNTKWTKISVFLNVFNVHVNRVPVTGKITKLNYQKGQFLSANLTEASLHNERQSAVVKTKEGQEVIFVQIAGLIARRIVCDLSEGQEVKTGDRYGIIRFGSRADIYLPDETKIKASIGQTMIGGETVIAELAAKGKAVKPKAKTTKAKTTKTKKATKAKKAK
jgi:phosphatidylserine decarboxylase